MAGMGPAPKSNGRRARRNKPEQPTTILRFEEAEQPELPKDYPWPDETLEWWKMWRDSPQAEHFGSTDWSFLLDTALLHANLWGNGDTSVLAELRIRVAKFGATPEDRARLRMQFAEADEADGRRPNQGRPSARERAKVIKLKTIDGGESR
ncbi:phage terminase small subunit [Corynebacterium pyruviciproducens]